MISDADIQRIKDVTDIVGLVGEYIPLKRAGSSFKALCPFHEEKTPSFHVVPAKQIFKCFGCGVAGDAFSFVMKHEGIDFIDAVRMLARRAGIEVKESEGERHARSERDRLYDASRWAQTFYAEQLASSDAARRARDYLNERGISQEMVARFGLGYAPPGWTGLLDRARARKGDVGVLTRAGLLKQKGDNDFHDHFCDRLMFPIVDTRDRVIGFGARCLDGSEPKYINSPETPIFNKSAALYGLNLAGTAMQKGGRAVVVEGYTDVIMAHQHDVTDVVAVLGTALTPDHVRLLRRFARRSVVVLDQDSAGQASADRSVNAFVSDGMDVSVGQLPAGTDPCDYLLEHGADAFENAIEGGLSPIAFKVARVTEAVQGRWDTSGALDPVLETIGLMPDPVAQEMAMRETAERTGVSEMALKLRLGQIRRPAPARPRGEAKPPNAPRRREAARELLAAMLCGEECAAHVRDTLDPAWISDPAVGTLVARALDLFTEAGEVDAAALLAATQDEQERAVIEGIIASEMEVEDPRRWCDDLMNRLRILDAERRATALEEDLRRAETPEEKIALAQKLSELRRQGQRRIGFGKKLVGRFRR